MSRRPLLLLVLALLLPEALRAQGEEALLRRLDRLAARQAELAAAVAARDSAAWGRERFVPVGREPLVVLVPGWVEPEVGPMVRSLVDSWTVRTGAIFIGAPPETLRVAVRSDTSGWTRTQVEAMLGSFPLEILRQAQMGVQERLKERIGSRMLSWAGSPLLLSDDRPARRGAIFALARDTTGVGSRCLEGEVRDCLGALARQDRTVGAVRRSLLAFTLDRAGPAGWELLARDTLGAPETRIGQVAGRGYEAAVEAWLRDLRSPRPRDPGDPWLVPVTIGWSLALVAVFLWRLPWHRG